ncbi:MAG TPA: hypothetical protein VFT69_15140 [Pseudolabrys sp.]|jgi:hypothetical protein|nr:hypothetical protein [Pseudolabrys sp.]
MSNDAALSLPSEALLAELLHPVERRLLGGAIFLHGYRCVRLLLLAALE